MVVLTQNAMLPFVFTPEVCFLTQQYYISADATITLPDKHIALSLLKSCQKVKNNQKRHMLEYIW